MGRERREGGEGGRLSRAEWPGCRGGGGAGGSTSTGIDKQVTWYIRHHKGSTVEGGAGKSLIELIMQGFVRVPR